MTDQATESHRPSPPVGVSSSEGLGPLPPQRDGQAHTMLRTMCGIGKDCQQELGHWLSPAAALERIDAALAAERERHADALRCALEALDYCIEDSAEILAERTVQWGHYRKDRQAAMAATLERHRAVAERLRAMLRA